MDKLISITFYKRPTVKYSDFDKIEVVIMTIIN